MTRVTSSGPVEAAERGATRIADRVVAKIAAQAAREALEAVPAEGSRPHASVTVHHDIARVRISLDLDYPSDIGGQCASVRRQVSQRVNALAGMEVPEVAVQVERLHSVHSRGAAKGRIR
ncbi:alkaline shock response membrane anchor protein AmaP [Streptomyces sp. A3M-1-3]|uniref:alkaline shock response membrane anchor protein AmaP n=1 Tax=Streptomyces sp. A3M-1-3 TaxID=2962044 RepID=UPI0020B8AFD0|nr:alkaline shock response membrane anchor protein AmaP [Streptomyces sp. A3M-1-3]MCP3821275.1 alkaline shock response membrane anchor protein AmaP [Streptomyces sp. A3M-1-3]